MSDSLIQVVKFIINIKSLLLTFLFLDEEMALAAQDACIAISGLVEQLNTHTGIFSRLRNAVEAGDINHESEVDRHVARLFLQDFLQCGIHLSDDDREKVVFLNDQILRLGMIIVFCPVEIVFFYCRPTICGRMSSAQNHRCEYSTGKRKTIISRGEKWDNSHVGPVF